MIPTAVSNLANNQTSASAMIGIASLILEGRALSDDNFIIDDNDLGDTEISNDIGERYTNINHITGSKNLTNLSSSSSSSTSSSSSSSSSLIWATNNINNPTNNLSSSSSSGYYSSSYNRINNADNTDATLQHFQRLRQKLGQLRQSSPSTSWECIPPEQRISVGSSRIGNTQSIAEGDIEDDDGELDPFIHQRKIKPNGQNAVANDGNLLNTLQSLASTCLRHSTPRSFSKNRDWLVSSLVFSTPINSNCNSNVSSSCNISNNSSTINVGANCSNSNSSGQQSIIKAVQMQKLNSNNISNNREGKISPPKQGPHCDQFLKKMGLLKSEISDTEEHICDMANLNEICYRWQIHCRQIDVIMSRSDPICIEVFLGPENHEILLEQWIIQQIERSPSPNMTLQSLCNAIRSQLYFSQITAWSDLIRKSKSYDREVMNNVRIKTPCKSNGILLKPRLDIFYRIKAYDSTACFISKPNVHNFPNIIISDNCTISVCLKSLPRLQGGIPKNDEIFTPLCASSSSSAITDNNDCSDYHHSQHHNNSHHLHQISSNLIATHHNTSETIMLDDRLNLPCQEKGKHKCAFDEEDGSSDTVAESACSEGLSHREKQLIKYKKRMMKRDKKNKKSNEIIPTSTAVCSSPASTFSPSLLALSSSLSPTSSSSSSSSPSPSSTSSVIKPDCYHQQNVKFEKKQYDNGIQDNHYDHHVNSELIIMNGSQQKLNEIRSINSIRPPLYQATSSVTEAIQTNTIEMISIGTQTSSDYQMYQQQQYPTCKNCGKDMQYICWNCEDQKLAAHSCGDSNNVQCTDMLQTPKKIGKGDLLLQAIQRTPQRSKNQDYRNNNNSVDFRMSTSSNSGDCQLCKRQKIRHNYNDQQQQNGNTNYHTNNSNESFRTVSNGHIQTNKCCQRLILSNEKSPSNSKGDKCDCMQPLTVCLDEISNNVTTNNSTTVTPPSPMLSSNSYKDDILENGMPLSSSTSITSILPVSVTKLFHCDDMSAQMKTPETHPIPKNQLKPSLLEINNYNKTTVATTKPSKSLPKVNLSNIFCSPSSPIPICSTESFSFDDSITSPEIPVQKSNSAPTLPNSPSLSPRFLKQAAIYKRRSRHLSDRSSERSSFGSDEQYSDEDLDSVYSPATSPIKTKVFLRSSAFGRKPLLGSLEESLLQKRCIPKTQVAGFKVLLGASGGFCPTQLTIPAATYCYEFSGQTISTPYVCEIHLSRKGYTIPRVGTLQATLLNPLGTVVRMFVIPYDFRDMPPMHQTFIRQRILAVDDNDGGKSTTTTTPAAATTATIATLGTTTVKSSSLLPNETSLNSNNKTSNMLASGSQSELREISFGDQMRSLRYSIHLRFQTSRSGRLALHTDIRFLISRRTDCDTAAAHAKGALESPNELRTITISPNNPKYSARHESPNKI